MKNALLKFSSLLSKQIVSEIQSWAKHRELAKLLHKLQSVHEPQLFLNHYAEAMVARHLLKQGCTLQVEVPTLRSRRADFKVSKDDHTFFLHIKRHNADEATAKEIKLQSRLLELRKIQRPVILSIQFWEIPSDAEMQRVYDEAKKFSLHGSVGESVLLSAMDGDALAEFQLREYSSSKHVALMMTMSVRCLDDRKRFYKKLSDAYKQSMPNALNVILITSPWDNDIEDIDSALLGTTFEELDIQGHVIQHGRKNDGFWSQDKHPHCQAVGYFTFGLDKDYIYFKMWYPENLQVLPYLQDLFASD